MISPEVCSLPVYRQRKLQILLLVSLIPMLGYSLINPAFPKIIDNLGISPPEVGLLITFYGVPGLLFIPISGALADRFGRKRVLVPSLLLFGVAGGSCAFFQDFNTILMLRFLQGLGGAAVFPMCSTLIGDFYSGKECTQAMGYNFSVSYMASAAYPFVGGAVALLAWYYPFLIYFVAVPIGILVLFKLENPKSCERQGAFDYLSNIAKIFRNRRIVGLFAASFLMFLIYSSAYATYFSLLLGGKFGASSLVIGLVVSIGSATTGITSWQMSKLARRFSEMNLIKAAFVLIAVSIFSVQFASELWMVVVMAIIFGIGLGTIDPGKISVLSSLASPNHRATLMSLDETFVVLGMTLGPVVLGAVFVFGGLTGVFNAGAVLALVSFALMVFLLRPDDHGKSV